MMSFMVLDANIIIQDHSGHHFSTKGPDHKWEKFLRFGQNILNLRSSSIFPPIGNMNEVLNNLLAHQVQIWGIIMFFSFVNAFDNELTTR